MRTRRKALSPVVASIILIAVTVAVSIAVAAWMGALTFTFMATEELKITNVEFITGGSLVNITMQNTGTSPITVEEIRINQGNDLLSSDVTVAANTVVEQQVSYSWTQGNAYQIKVQTSKGNQYYYNANAPTS
jgi:flagellin-like protein